jgi:hypothetical protein
MLLIHTINFFTFSFSFSFFFFAFFFLLLLLLIFFISIDLVNLLLLLVITPIHTSSDLPFCLLVQPCAAALRDPLKLLQASAAVRAHQHAVVHSEGERGCCFCGLNLFHQTDAADVVDAHVTVAKLGAELVQLSRHFLDVNVPCCSL